MECPTCNKESQPLCPFYDGCKYRHSQLQAERVCWKTPHYCDIYRKKNRRAPPTEREEEFNPSERDNDVDM